MKDRVTNLMTACAVVMAVLAIIISAAAVANAEIRGTLSMGWEPPQIGGEVLHYRVTCSGDAGEIFAAETEETSIDVILDLDPGEYECSLVAVGPERMPSCVVTQTSMRPETPQVMDIVLQCEWTGDPDSPPAVVAFGVALD